MSCNGLKHLLNCGLAIGASFALVACGDDSTSGSSAGETDTDGTDSGSGTDSGTAGTVSGTGTSGATDSSSAGTDSGTSASTGTGGTGTATSSGTGGSGSTGGSGTTGGGSECTDATECETSFGVAPCGAWECNNGYCDVVCADCADSDLDGYGVGNGCAGADCDDGDDTVFDTAQQSCYSGPANTDGVGTCMAGQEVCTDGTWTPCVGEVVPSGEACNGEDDDCNGTVDDGLGNFSCGLGACGASVAACANGTVGVCQPGNAVGPDTTCDGIDDDCDGIVDELCLANCVWVTPGGSANGDGTQGNPLDTIQGGINAAGAGDQVCVASNGCGSPANYVENVVMANGISVFGSYNANNFTRCNPGTRNTIISPTNGTGVLFGNGVSSVTALDGFEINRPNLTTSAGITVDGATQVTIADVEMQANTGGSVTDSYGVNMINGAEATITRSLIYGGNGTGENVGVRSVGSTPTIVDNCDSFDASGRCDVNCGWINSTQNGIRGRYTPKGGTAAHAVYLEASPGALIQESSICGHNTTMDGATIRIVGDAAGTVIRANYLNGWGGDANSHGIWLEDCSDAAPWIVDNFRIVGESSNPTANVDGIRSIGQCHPVIDGNVEITGGAEGGAAAPNGVYCGANGNGASQCVILGNQLIQGAAFGFPPITAGVRCDDDGCMKIANNTILGNGGDQVYGIWLQESGTFIDDNDITGGCGQTSSTGLFSDNSFARVQNNRISAGSCNGSISAANVGVHAVLEDGANHIDVHSNTIDGAGTAGACTSTGLEVESGNPAPVTPMGTFRNNIVRGGECNTSYGVLEADAMADPAIFENNDLDPYNTPNALYEDADTASVNTAAGVNALTDMTVSGNIDGDPQFVSYPTDLHIQGGSVCDAAGTPTGAPATDMDGQARDGTTPDIGADEI